MVLALGLLLALSLGLALLSWIAQGRMLARPALRPAHPRPVSILKPLKGADPALADNLRSLFAVAARDHELVFALADADDAALPIVQALMVEHPEVSARLVISARRIGPNPKVNNLAIAAAAATHDLLLISDSNVRVERGYVEDLVAHLEDSALACSLIRGSGESGLGGRLEAFQLNSFVMSGVAAWTDLFGGTAVIGKSMLLRRETLAEIGGFEFLSQFLAEDQVCGEEVARRGGRVVVSGRPVDNTLGRLSVRDFCRRHVRWACMRRRNNLTAYAAELLLNPVGLALIALVALRSTQVVAAFGAALLAMSLLGLSSERRLGIRRAALHYPAVELLRATLVLALWPWPLVTSRVTWRGHRLRIGPRTRFVERAPAAASLEVLTDSAMEPTA